jgi:glycerophosphoryl diester phosphodiesterase
MTLPAPPWIIGHRGAAGERIENTLASFRLAIEQGADWLELDVQFAADGELVVVHDWDLRRLAGSALLIERSKWGDLEIARAARGRPRRDDSGSDPAAARRAGDLSGRLPAQRRAQAARRRPRAVRRGAVG